MITLYLSHQLFFTTDSYYRELDRDLDEDAPLKMPLTDAAINVSVAYATPSNAALGVVSENHSSTVSQVSGCPMGMPQKVVTLTV